MDVGKAIKFGDNIDTDQIISGEFLCLPTIKDMVKYTFRNCENFIENFHEGDFIVGGNNFGSGSAREQAVSVLKEIGVKAVIAKDFARIFYRNALNLGVLVLECNDADKISNLDVLQIDINSGTIINLTQKVTYKINPIPEFIKEIIHAGGVVNYLKNKSK